MCVIGVVVDEIFVGYEICVFGFVYLGNDFVDFCYGFWVDVVVGQEEEIVCCYVESFLKILCSGGFLQWEIWYFKCESVFVGMVWCFYGNSVW